MAVWGDLPWHPDGGAGSRRPRVRARGGAFNTGGHFGGQRVMPDKEFDLSRFHSLHRLQGFRFIELPVEVFAGFSAFGVALGWALTGAVSGWIFWTLVGICSASGFYPLGVVLLGGRPFRWLRSITLVDLGFRLVDSSNRRLEYRWGDPDLEFKLTQRTWELPRGSSQSWPWWLGIRQHDCCGFIGGEARDALLDRARLEGLSVYEREFDMAGLPPGPQEFGLARYRRWKSPHVVRQTTVSRSPTPLQTKVPD